MPQSNMAAIATARQHSSQGDSDPPSSPADTGCVEQRESRLKATQFLREAKTTRRLVDKLEKDRSLIFQWKKNGWTDMATELDEYEKALVEQRSAEKMQLRNQLAKIKDGVRQFQQQLIDMKPSTELIEKLKEIMAEVECSINNFKEKQRLCFGELLKKESMCAQEMEAYERKVESWSQSSKSDSKVSPVSSVKSKALDQDLPAEVRALEAFLQRTGGVCGGWEEFDHQAFLKVWTKCGGRAGFRKEAKLYLPSKSQEEMEEHERWYQELIHLQDERREAIRRWKSRKQLERQRHLHKQTKVVEAEKRKKDASEEEKKLLAQRLKARKEAKRRKEEQAEKQRQARESRKNRMAKQERSGQREAKMSPGEELQVGRGEEEDHRRTKRRKQATKTIKYLMQRDLARVHAKRQEKLLRQKEDEERQERIMAKLKEKVDGHIVRDPSRLTRPTKGWEERLKSTRPSGVGHIFHMSQRAFPIWRLEL
ncbi:coiled-coil domain-containing protein 112 isoform X2 [Hippocampus comes]|uniref:coiled-coil domain-containing protein 112 isoform X2 n=1 Tax=Hippocampus comes TaxID=109280 RepID=UPI00094F0A66|nr:PREDICTED: coiled-coil domain-containing protein 112 isoform X2 [Hippocampus comes]